MLHKKMRNIPLLSLQPVIQASSRDET